MTRYREDEANECGTADLQQVTRDSKGRAAKDEVRAAQHTGEVIKDAGYF